MRILIIISFILLSIAVNGQITINTLFDVKTNNPIDDRMRITNLSDTSSLTFKYEGMLTYVNDLGEYWIFKNNQWQVYISGISSNPYVYTFNVDSKADSSNVSFYATSSDNIYALPTGTLKGNNTVYYSSDATALVEQGEYYFLSSNNVYGLPEGTARFKNPLVTYVSDEDAFKAGVDFGDLYPVSFNNIYGLPENVGKELKYNRKREPKETGWVEYKDNQYTDINPLVVNEGSTVTVFNNASTVLDEFIPTGIDSLWSRTDSTFIPENVGDTYVIRVDFTAKTDSNQGYATLKLDIGGSLGVIVSDIFTFPKGIGVAENFSKTYLVYTLDTFVNNGGKFKITGGTGTTTIYNVDFIISRIHKAS